MKILAIETSCDETAVAVVEGDGSGMVRVLGEAVASSEEMHVKTGGIVPEVAAREQLVSMVPVVKEAIGQVVGIEGKAQQVFSRRSRRRSDKNNNFQEKSLTNSELIEWVGNNIDAIAVTQGPGLIGSLLVGVETAKALAWSWEKPLVAVNHLVGHLYANFIGASDKQALSSNHQHHREIVPEFPAVGLVVSGGHTDLVVMRSHGKIKWLGGTRDDAAGECLDKCARVLGLPYPGGPHISAKAARVQGSKLKVQTSKLPRPMIESEDYDFSFSGLKVVVLNEVKSLGGNLSQEQVSFLCCELQEAVVEVLVAKVRMAVDEFGVKSVLLSGGVAANSRLREGLGSELQNSKTKPKFFVPEKKYCTDNAAMIGVAAIYNYTPLSLVKIKADPGMSLRDY